MKKFCILLIVVLLVISLSNNSSAFRRMRDYFKMDQIKAKYNQFLFRKTCWGMSRYEVYVTEKFYDNSRLIHRGPKESKTKKLLGIIPYRSLPVLNPNLNNDYIFEYSVLDVANYDMLLRYHFLDKKLISASYILAESIDKKRYYEIYKYYRYLLSTKYGDPVLDKEIKKNKDLIDYTYSKSTAIAYDYLNYISTWDTSKTHIELRLFGKRLKQTLGIYYESKDLANKIKINYNNF